MVIRKMSAGDSLPLVKLDATPPPSKTLLHLRRLQLFAVFGHIARSEPEMDHRRALRAAI